MNYIIFYLSIFSVIIMFFILCFFIWISIFKNYEVIYLKVSLTKKLNLYGLNQKKNEPYCVINNDGSKWFLSKTQKNIGPGSYLLEFRQKKLKNERVEE